MDDAMRKILILLLVVFVAFQAFASVPQKIHPVDSPLYRIIKDIYLMTGHAMPSSTGPWSSAELDDMIDRIPESEVPDYLKDGYAKVKSELDRELRRDFGSMSLQFSANTSVELFAHTNTDGLTRTDINGVTEKLFTGRESWAYDTIHQNPFLELDIEFDVKDHFYFFMAPQIRTGFHFGTGWQNEFGATHVGSNIPFLHFIDGDKFLSWDMNMPYRTFASFGSDGWTVQLGRDRLNWGLGKTGNLAMSDNLPYHDMARFTAFSKSFKYTFLVSSYPHEANFYDPYQGSEAKGRIEKEPLKGIKLYLAHRFEGRVIKDKLSFSITEAIMYASKDGIIDPRVLIPISIYHNLYTPSETNSTIVGEIDYTPVKGLNIYAQLIVDDLAIAGESAGGPANRGYPNAIGILAGATYATGLFDGLVKINLEGALVNPYTYLRYSQDPYDASSESYGLNYVVATRSYITGRGNDALVYDEYYLGYRYGADSLVANLNVEWKRPGSLTLSANAFFLAHGTHDMWTQWSEIGGDGDEEWKKTSVTPTSKHETENYRYDDDELSLRKAVSYTLDIGAFCQYQVNEKLRVYGQADFIQIWNVYNRKDINDSDAQFVVGLRYSL